MIELSELVRAGQRHAFASGTRYDSPFTAECKSVLEGGEGPSLLLQDCLHPLRGVALEFGHDMGVGIHSQGDL